MGIEDRDYFQEDRKRREKIYGEDFRGSGKKSWRKDIYYRPKEFRRDRGNGRVRRSIGGWDGQGEKGKPFSATSAAIFITIGTLISLGLKSFGII